MISTGCLDGCERGACRAKEPCLPWTLRPTACTVMTQQSAPGKQERQWWQEHRVGALGTAGCTSRDGQGMGRGGQLWVCWLWRMLRPTQPPESP